MVVRDSLGVPLEPEAEQHIGVDWKGSTVYEGDYVYFTPDDEIVLENDLDNWIEFTLGTAVPLNKSDI